MEEIYLKSDVIIKQRYTHKMTTNQQFALYHYISFLDEWVDIIKEKYPEYFVFGVLLELDEKYNLKADDDIKNIIIKRTGKKVKNSYDYQARLETFLWKELEICFMIIIGKKGMKYQLLIFRNELNFL